MNYIQNISLKPFHTFAIDVNAKLFYQFYSEEDLLKVTQSNSLKENPLLVLGGGSNILFTSDFDGLVIRNNIQGIEIIKQNKEYAWIKAGGGLNWHSLVLFSIEENLGGLENLSLIPGTSGAAPMQNIGAYGVEIKDTFESLEAIEIQNGARHIFTAEDCKFGYRYSVFKDHLKNQFIITSVTFRLKKQPEFNISYGAIQETLDKMGVKKLTLKAISDAVISIRSSKLPDPAEIGNAGSFFKNPTISSAHYLKIKEEYSNVRGYPSSEGDVKIPAGWLIEQCGWKGKRFGDAGVHRNQALVLVNYGNAKGSEIKKLAEEVQQSVLDRFKINLHFEVNIY